MKKAGKVPRTLISERGLPNRERQVATVMLHLQLEHVCMFWSRFRIFLNFFQKVTKIELCWREINQMNTNRDYRLSKKRDTSVQALYVLLKFYKPCPHRFYTALNSTSVSDYHIFIELLGIIVHLTRQTQDMSYGGGGGYGTFF